MGFGLPPQGTNGNDNLRTTFIFRMLDGKGGNDTLTGGSWPGGDLLTGGTGNDLINGKGGTGDNLAGGDGNDTIIGGSSADILSDGQGDDIVTAGAGNDLITGGSGNDLYNSGAGNDTFQLFGNGADTITDASGSDTMIVQSSRSIFTGLTFAGVDTDSNGKFDSLSISSGSASILVKEFFNDASSFEEDLGKGSGAIDRFIFVTGAIDGVMDFDDIKPLVGNWSDPNQTVTTDGGTGNDILKGYVYKDVLNGLAGNDKLSGFGNTDTLNGGSGNDLLDGGTNNDDLTGGDGLDTLIGGVGDDTYRWVGSGLDLINDADGLDTLDMGALTFVQFDADYTLTALDLYKANGSNGTDGKFDSLSISNSGGEVLRILNFFAGDENYRDIVSQGDGAIETFKFNGVDKTFAEVTDLVANMQLTTDVTVRSSSTRNDRITGYRFLDSINGQAGNDTLFGQAGNDTLRGSIGNDVIDGGADNDLIEGNEGNDKIFGGLGLDTITGDAGNDVIDGGDGNDSLGGGDGNDAILGGLGNDTITGGNGLDVLTGGLGDELYNISGTGLDKILDAGGTDIIDLDLTFANLDSLYTLNAVDLYKNTAGRLGSDGKWDSLSVNLGTQQVLLISNFFDNSSASLTSLAAGSGAIENWQLETNYTFNDIYGLIEGLP